MSDALRAELSRVAARLGADGVEFVLERPRTRGTVTSPPIWPWCWPGGSAPIPAQTAERVLDELRLSPELVARTEIAGPGFINFWLARNQLAAGAPPHPRRRAGLRPLRRGAGLRVNVEFVSANPTGPLHVGHGRGAALGDGIAALLEWAGHTVTREFYINDAGVQIDKLAQSLWARVQEAVGRSGGDPRGRLSRRIPARERARGARARGPRLRRPPARRGSPPVPRARAPDPARGAGPGPPRLRRPVRRDELGAGGSTTAAGSSARWRFSRSGASRTRPRARSGCERRSSATTRIGFFGRATGAIPISFPTSRTTSTSTSAASTAPSTSGARTITATSRACAPCCRRSGCPPDFFDVALVQLVKVERGGEEVKMSKRSGQFVTLRDLYEEVGVDAARYFFLCAKGETPMVFDIDLAQKQTDENPVFYVQMAHARLSGIFRTADRDAESVDGRPRSGRAAGPAGHRASQEARAASRDRREGRARSASRIGSPSICTSWPPPCTPGITIPAPSVRPRGRPPSRPACCSRGRHASCSPTRSPCSASPPPTGCDLMSLLVVGSIALDSIFTPFGETADALGGSAVYFSVAGSMLHPVQVVGVVGQRLSAGRARAPGAARDRLDGCRARRRARAFAGRGSTPTTCRAGRRWRPGSACSPTSSPSCPTAFRSAEFVFLGNIDPELQLGVLDAGQAARAGRVRHDELLDPGQEGGAARAALAGRHPHGERWRGARAQRRLEHPSRRPMDSGPRARSGWSSSRASTARSSSSAERTFYVPAFPLETVFDPTGAGDAFAGGFMAYLARTGTVSEDNLRRAMVYGATWGRTRWSSSASGGSRA